MLERECFLSADECAAVRRHIDAAKSGPAYVFEREAYVVRERHRRTLLADVEPSVAAAITEKLSAVRPLLEVHFGVTLSTCAGPEFLKYVPGDRFRPHSDTVENDSVPSEVRRREISVIIFFNDQIPSDNAPSYAGGELVFYRDPALSTWATARVPIAPATGTLLAFRSKTLHEVREVSAGSRYTAVTWFYRGEHLA